MQRNQRVPKKLRPHLANEMGDHNFYNLPSASAFGTNLPSSEKPSMPFHGVEFQSAAFCPRNFIVFDQTDTRSQVMFNPAIADKLNFNYPCINMNSTYIQHIAEGKFVKNEEIERENQIPAKEDSGDIDALLSLEEEEEEEEEYDEDEISTGRTNGNYGNRSPDSCSDCGSKARKNRLSASIQKSSSSGNSCNSDRKRMKLKKMVKVLRGIVPGGEEMHTVDVLDEAVKYLKSLKVEVQNMGLGDLPN